MLVEGLLEGGFMLLLHLVLVTEGTVEGVLQGNVVVKIDLLCPLEGEFCCIKVPQE